MKIETKRIFIKKLLKGEKILLDFVDLGSSENINLLELKNKWQEYLLSDFIKGGIKFYIHIPFCIKRCNYCMYNTLVLDDNKRDTEINNYLDFIINYYDFFKPIFNNIKFRGLYIGGGTPSILSEKQLYRFLSYINDNILFEDAYFKTIELNPYSTNFRKIDIISSSGIDRISFGVQSFSKKILDLENRDYVSPNRIKDLINYTISKGIININLDIIFGLETDNEDNILYTLKKLKTIGASEINIYIILKNKEKSTFYKKSGKNSFFSLSNERLLFLVEESGIKENYNLSINSHVIGISLSKKGHLIDKNCYECHSNDNSSLFSVGYKSYSKIWNRGYYNNFNKITEIKSDSLIKNFYKINNNIEMYIYILKSFQYIINKKDFKKIFGFDIYDRFRNELDFYIDNKIVIDSEEEIKYIGDKDKIGENGLLFLDTKILIKYLKSLKNKRKT